MATWIDPIESETDPDAPLTSGLGKRWDNNPIAMGECAEGAPYMQTAWHPFDGVYDGDGKDGVIYDFAVDGAVSSVDYTTWLDGYEYGFIFDGLAHVGDTRVYSYRNGAYSSLAVLFTASANDINGGIMYAPRPFAAAQRRVLKFESPVFKSATDFVEDPFLIDTSGTPVTWTGLSIEAASGNFTAGRIIMVKRKAYV